MDLNYVIERLAATPRYSRVDKEINAELAVWKPAPGKWSILEVVNHLYDEEREDFRQRLELVLKDPALAWPPWRQRMGNDRATAKRGSG